jgi:hypothetical protein
MPHGLRRKAPDHVKKAIVEQAIRGKVQSPDLAKLVNHFFEVCGGERAFAVMLYGEFAAAEEGSGTRQRILDMVIRALAKTSEANQGEEEMGLLTEEQLEAEILAIASEVIDAQSSDEPTEPETEGGPAEGGEPAPG